ncbi:Phosphate acyltransferase [Candidatus Xenohaliotis californiensis]|uniref:Phosphate acyltransferase n=1 Tax=Candidatus Xenohaliotis californiensis TaxID=84677 RepID=A0ABP0EZ16_9RICK|nr:Phosphate acyltransferase [Candidatus Xenohaliotis californiensis]
MHSKIKLSIDVMGGDYGALPIIEGADIFLKNHNDVFFNFYGEINTINKALSQFPILAQSSVTIPTTNIVPNDVKPSSVLRSYADSSMRLALNAAKNGETDGIVSPGNTGALMVMAKAFIGTLKNIDRPAMAAVIPSLKKPFIILDVGANITCDAEVMSQLAIMGNSYAKIVLNKQLPSIALLNIGSEAAKGKPEIKRAAQMLKNEVNKLNFMGYIEPNNIFLGDIDVVVTDGFSGNITIKTMEGVAHFLKNTIVQEESRASLRTKIGLYMAKNLFKKLNSKADHRIFNGGLLLGIDNIVVKSHGSADAFASSHAILTAYNAIKHQVNQKISTEIEKFIFE